MQVKENNITHEEDIDHAQGRGKSFFKERGKNGGQFSTSILDDAGAARKGGWVVGRGAGNRLVDFFENNKIFKKMTLRISW